MFRPIGSENHAENVCWLVPPDDNCNGQRFKSPFAAKVRWDCWSQKIGCCRTMGPPPKILINCPEQFLRKHSRQVPVFFSQDELRLTKSTSFKKSESQIQSQSNLENIDESPRSRNRKNVKQKECDIPRPPSRMGLFRHPKEPTYEAKYKLNRLANRTCDCEKMFWEDLIKATESAGQNAAKKEQMGGEGNNDNSPNSSPKDHIRANALNVIRMPARRMKRCYLDKSGVHLIDMSDSPFVLRPGFGKVPQYIYRRKLELYQRDLLTKSALQSAATMDQMPPDVAERDAVIRGLKEHWQDLQDEYNSLPLESEPGKPSPKLEALKISLETRMGEVEQDLRLLMKTRVLFIEDGP